METTEKIVEAYVRYVRRWATIPNIRCDGQFEIDLLAIDPVSLERYHIESGVSVSGSYSALHQAMNEPPAKSSVCHDRRGAVRPKLIVGGFGVTFVTGFALACRKA
jgi:hypothetical protein